MGSSRVVRQRLLFTLLFLGAVGLHRTWDLRSYTADGLALLTGRKQAYGYRYTEAFLSQLAHFDGAERLTDASSPLDKTALASSRGGNRVQACFDLLRRWSSQACVQRHADSSWTGWALGNDSWVPRPGLAPR
jgi:hypothetical protein